MAIRANTIPIPFRKDIFSLKITIPTKVETMTMATLCMVKMVELSRFSRFNALSTRSLAADKYNLTNPLQRTRPTTVYAPDSTAGSNVALQQTLQQVLTQLQELGARLDVLENP